MIRFSVLFLMTVGSLPLCPQDRQPPQEILDHARHLADLYNWDDAARALPRPRKMFLAAGDQRNALYARLGRIRSTVGQRALAETSLSSHLNWTTTPAANGQATPSVLSHRERRH